MGLNGDDEDVDEDDEVEDEAEEGELEEEATREEEHDDEQQDTEAEEEEESWLLWLRLLLTGGCEEQDCGTEATDEDEGEPMD